MSILAKMGIDDLMKNTTPDEAKFIIGKLGGKKNNEIFSEVSERMVKYKVQSIKKTLPDKIKKYVPFVIGASLLSNEKRGD